MINRIMQIVSPRIMVDKEAVNRLYLIYRRINKLKSIKSQLNKETEVELIDLCDRYLHKFNIKFKRYLHTINNKMKKDRR